MASSKDFVEYVCGQIAEIGVVEYRKMFGEYCVYLNGKAALLVCDNTVFIKQLPSIAHLVAEAETGHPYPGAKPHYILDPDDRYSLMKILTAAEPDLTYPKKRK